MGIEDFKIEPLSPLPGPQEQAQAAVEPEGPVPAGFNERFLAYAMDAFPFVLGTYLSLNAMVQAGVMAYTPGNVWKWKALWIAAYVLYETVFSSGGRATVGKLLMGIRVRANDGGDLSVVRSLVRALAYFLSSATLNLGYLAALVTPGNRALHDYISGSRVVSVRERGDLANGLVLALSWGLMAILIGSWLNQTVLKLSPGEKTQIIAAHRTISKLAKLEEIYMEREGHYTNDLKTLADLTGNVNAVRAELYKTLEPQTLTIASNGRRFKITAKARNWRKTEVEVLSRRDAPSAP
ncbi:MAG: RDD family protein [Elusimicrobiales bacterium]|nr:RDD family protein [Elusimicrobiales bacterium]